MPHALLLLVGILIGLSGCASSTSTDQQAATKLAKEERIAMFKRRMDGEVGKEFYVEMAKEEWCRANHCTKLGETTTEYAFRRNPSLQCVIAWVVDSRGSKGDYRHPSGMVLYNFGIRKSWRYVSKPELCYEAIHYSGSM